MSLVKRLLHPHYISNVILAVAYPAVQLITHPEFLNYSSIAAYSRYLLPALALLSVKVRGSQSAEELVSVVALYVKVYSLYGFWKIANDDRGPSNVICLNASQLKSLTTPKQEPFKGNERAEDHSEVRNRSSMAKIVELDDNGEPIDDEHLNMRKAKEYSQDEMLDEEQQPESQLSHSRYWIIAFSTTWSSPCRHFEAVLARCSIKNVHFAKIDMDLVPEGDQIAERFRINLAATTIDLPTLILFKDGRALKQLPLKLGTRVGGEVLGKVGWDRSESSVLDAFELTKLGTGKESFAK
ncbi:hypothetical protein BGX28_002521 [Mortierella sp. GBA30]|nr:hypothetical protein BGX28_002521 [Mortierella sp. GBA30]